MTEDEINTLYCNNCDAYINITKDDHKIIINLKDGDIVNIVCDQCYTIIYTTQIIKELFTEEDYDRPSES